MKKKRMAPRKRAKMLQTLAYARGVKKGFRDGWDSAIEARDKAEEEAFLAVQRLPGKAITVVSMEGKVSPHVFTPSNMVPGVDGAGAICKVCQLTMGEVPDIHIQPTEGPRTPPSWLNTRDTRFTRVPESLRSQ